MINTNSITICKAIINRIRHSAYCCKNTYHQPFIKYFLLTVTIVIMFADFSSAGIKNTLIDNKINFSQKYQSSSQFQKYLKNRLHQSSLSTERLPELDQLDLFYLTKYWNNLEKTVQNEYLSSIKIPDNFNVFISPGNNFEVYFSTVPISSALNSDTYGYDTLSNWRIKKNSPNGVPDYVDEIAWALDSSWSMDIIRFKFNQPLPYKDELHTSSRYKVITDNSGFYGSTYPILSEDMTNSPGWSSIISISTNWSDLGYDTNPHDAIRVTCTHEFFHSIQFAMMWNITSTSYDFFPISWLEGTAASMEELAFPDVNDYHQYTYKYFNEPVNPFFTDDNVSYDMYYSNSLLCLYIYNHLLSKADLSFVHTIMFNNYKSPTQFHQNLITVSNSYGTSWVNILHSFHTASFFSGPHADTDLFITDAPFFDSLHYSTDTTAGYNPIRKTIFPYAMNIFTYEPKALITDTLHVNLQHITSNDAAVDKPWDASAIVMKPDRDTLIHIDLDSFGDGTLDIAGISTSDRILVFVTNGQPSKTRRYSVSFNNCPVTHKAEEHFTTNVPAKDSSCSVLLSVKTNSVVRCDESISETTQQSIIDKAKTAGFHQVSPVFSLTFPNVWIGTTDRTLSFLIPHYKDTLHSSIYFWNDTSLTWQKCDNVLFSNIKDTLHASIDNPTIGLYSFFKELSEISVSVYPNPVSLRNGSLNFDGALFHSISLYNASGKHIYSIKFHDETISTQWQLNNISKKTITPGFYLAYIKYYEYNSRELQTVNKKILVTP